MSSASAIIRLIYPAWLLAIEEFPKYDCCLHRVYQYRSQYEGVFRQILVVDALDKLARFFYHIRIPEIPVKASKCVWICPVNDACLW